jgi:hypothetical protein
MALDKEPFADENAPESSLPSATLGKGFVEGRTAFAECLGHSAKNLSPVVIPLKACHTFLLITKDSRSTFKASGS